MKAWILQLTTLHNSRRQSHMSRLCHLLLIPEGFCKDQDYISMLQTEHQLVGVRAEGEPEQVIRCQYFCLLTCKGVHPCVSVSRTDAWPLVSNVCTPLMLPVLQNSKMSESSGTAEKVLRVFFHPR